MELSEGQTIEKHGKECEHRSRNTLLPSEFEFTCSSCGYNVIKRKHDLKKIQRKRMNFINRLKYAEHKIFSPSIVIIYFSVKITLFKPKKEKIKKL